MWKKDISKQNLFLSAPIYGKYSERLKGFCLLKALEKKIEVKDGITVMKQCLAQKKDNLFIRIFHLTARNTVGGGGSDREVINTFFLTLIKVLMSMILF